MARCNSRSLTSIMIVMHVDEEEDAATILIVLPARRQQEIVAENI